MKKSIILLVSALLSLGAMQAANPVYEKCPGESQELKTTKTGDSYQWYKNGSPISGATNNKYTVTNIQEDATYKCEVKKNASSTNTGNLIPSGNFDFAPTAKPTSGGGIVFKDNINDPIRGISYNIEYQMYDFSTNGSCDPGHYTTTSNPNNIKSQYFCSITPKSGSHMLACDGKNDQNWKVLYVRDLHVKQGQTYEFSCYVANIDKEYFTKNHGEVSLPKLKFTIDDGSGDKDLGTGYMKMPTPTSESDLGKWIKFEATYTAPNDRDYVHISIYNSTAGTEGNDFAIDEVYFGATRNTSGSTEYDEFQIKLKDCEGTESITHPEQTNCPEQEVTLTCDTDITGAISVTWEHDSSNKTKTATVKTGATVGDSKPYKCTIVKTENSKTITYTETFKVTTIDCSSRDSIIHNLEGCPGQEVQLVCDKTGASITWAHDESIKTNSTTVKTNLTTDKVDKYTCTIVNTVNGETTTYIEVFYVKTEVCTDANSEHEKVLVGSDITIMSQYSGVSGATYQWYKIEEDGTRTPVGNEESLTFQADKNAKYECITVLPTGVTVTETREVEIYTAPTLEPDIFFTPNNDGLNDLWKIKGIENAPNAHIMIYDRNSKLLYKSVGSDFKGWDGNYNGHGMVQDDYWYVILVPENDDTISGHFILKR